MPLRLNWPREVSQLLKAFASKRRLLNFVAAFVRSRGTVLAALRVRGTLALLVSVAA